MDTINNTVDTPNSTITLKKLSEAMLIMKGFKIKESSFMPENMILLEAKEGYVGWYDIEKGKLYCADVSFPEMTMDIMKPEPFNKDVYYLNLGLSMRKPTYG